MRISGDEIREEALERSETAKPAMNSFYYGFREGAKWMQEQWMKKNSTI